MSYFTVLVIGDNHEQQLAPYQENNMGDCPSEYMKFNDIEEESRKKYDSESRSEFYCASSSSWGQAISPGVWGKLMALQVGDSLEVRVGKKVEVDDDETTTTGLGNYFKKGNRYHCYNTKKQKSPDDKDKVWIMVTHILWTNHPDKDVVFDGRINVQRIDPPKEIKHTDKYSTFEEFMSDWYGHDGVDEKTGKYGYWDNPNRKWDWFTIGGRWSGYFKLKPVSPGIVDQDQLEYLEKIRHTNIDLYNAEMQRYSMPIEITGKKISVLQKDPDEELLPEHRLGCPGVGNNLPKHDADQAKKGDIDWEYMVNYNRIKAEETWAKYEEDLENEEGKRKHPHFEFGIAEGDTRESFITRAQNFATFAVVKDSKWYEKGEMGWWGIVSNEKDPNEWVVKFKELLEELSDDTILTIVDCHI